MPKPGLNLRRRLLVVPFGCCFMLGWGAWTGLLWTVGGILMIAFGILVMTVGALQQSVWRPGEHPYLAVVTDRTVITLGLLIGIAAMYLELGMSGSVGYVGLIIMLTIALSGVLWFDLLRVWRRQHQQTSPPPKESGPAEAQVALQVPESFLRLARSAAIMMLASAAPRLFLFYYAGITLLNIPAILVVFLAVVDLYDRITVGLGMLAADYNVAGFSLPTRVGDTQLWEALILTALLMGYGLLALTLAEPPMGLVLLGLMVVLLACDVVVSVIVYRRR